MARTRSPQYPAIGLKEAVEKIAEVYEKDYQNKLPREVIARHMGYQGLNGKSLGVLSALNKFGLLEGRADESRVSDLAMSIIAHPVGTMERYTAIKAASGMPDLFAEIDQRFQSGKVSDQAIRSYLLTQKFIPTAVDAAIRSYRETKQLVETEAVDYDASQAKADIAEASHRVEWFPESHRLVASSPTGASKPMIEGMSVPSANPMKVVMTGDRIEVMALLSDAEAVDKLIKFLEANKPLLPAKPKSDDPVLS